MNSNKKFMQAIEETNKKWERLRKQRSAALSYTKGLTETLRALEAILCSEEPALARCEKALIIIDAVLNTEKRAAEEKANDIHREGSFVLPTGVKRFEGTDDELAKALLTDELAPVMTHRIKKRR